MKASLVVHSVVDPERVKLRVAVVAGFAMFALFLASWTVHGLTLVTEEAANPIRKVVTLLQVRPLALL